VPNQQFHQLCVCDKRQIKDSKGGGNISLSINIALT
jgi:hypothetical protein